MKSTYLIEDHDEALKIWRRRRIRNVDLVHVDAHIDLRAPAARSVAQILEDAKSVRDVKKGLEDLVAFQWYEKDLGKQTHMGNYIYPALREGIVKDFYWVVPGDAIEFSRQIPLIRGILRYALKDVALLRFDVREAIVRTSYLGHEIVVCCLEKLPVLAASVLLDVDADFFVTPRLDAADPSRFLGLRRVSIPPKEAVRQLRQKGVVSVLTTIAYSGRGGYTPPRFRYLARDFASAWEGGGRNTGELRRQKEAGRSFEAFERFKTPFLYRRAVRLDPGLRYADNHNGFFYLVRRRLGSAEREFCRVLRADPEHAGAWLGRGDAALAKKRYDTALSYFLKAERLCRRQKAFREWVSDTLSGQLACLVKLGRDREAWRLSLRLQNREPLDPVVYFWKGVLKERAGDHLVAVRYFQDAVRLDYQGLDPLEHLLKICCSLEIKNAIIDYVRRMLKRFIEVWKQRCQVWDISPRADRAMRRRITRMAQRVARLQKG